MKDRVFKIIDIDAEVIVEVVSRKEVLSWLDEYIENLKYDWFDGSDNCFHILYKDGSYDYVNEEYDGHKVKRQHIASIVYDNACSSMVYGNFEINEYGVVTVAFEEKIASENILEVEEITETEVEAVEEKEESSMKLELVKQIADEKRTCALYTIGDYEVDVIYGDVAKRISISKDYREEFLPEIYFDNGEFQIQTTSYGSLNPSDIKKVIEGYEEALKIVEVLTAELLIEKEVEEVETEIEEVEVMKEYPFDELGYFNESECQAIKEELDGKTYMNFDIVWSNCCGNCTLIIRTDYEGEPQEIKNLFLNVALSTIFNLKRK